MIGKYYTTLGFYEPSVFHLHTLGDGKINEMNKWSDKQKSTFLHEYIHFLQDISTVQGLQNIYIGGEYLRFVTQEVFANKNSLSEHLSFLVFQAKMLGLIGWLKSIQWGTCL